MSVWRGGGGSIPPLVHFPPLAAVLLMSLLSQFTVHTVLSFLSLFCFSSSFSSPSPKTENRKPKTSQPPLSPPASSPSSSSWYLPRSRLHPPPTLPTLPLVSFPRGDVRPQRNVLHDVLFGSYEYRSKKREEARSGHRRCSMFGYIVRPKTEKLFAYKYKIDFRCRS